MFNSVLGARFQILFDTEVEAVGTQIQRPSFGAFTGWIAAFDSFFVGRGSRRRGT